MAEAVNLNHTLIQALLQPTGFHSLIPLLVIYAIGLKLLSEHWEEGKIIFYD